MSVVAFVNGDLGVRVLPILEERGPLCAVVVHPADRARGRELFQHIAGRTGAALIEATELADPECQRRLRALRPEWGLSAGFGYILRPAIFEIPLHGTLNVHTSLLPWNRGAHPNVWTLVDETPAGVTMHWVDRGVDTGDILMQREIAYDWTDTAETLQTRLVDTAAAIVAEHWPPSPSLVARRRPQGPGGTVHRVADLATLDALDLNAVMPVRRILNIMRARTFPPFRASGIVTDQGFVEMPLTPRRIAGSDAREP